LKEYEKAVLGNVAFLVVNGGRGHEYIKPIQRFFTPFEIYIFCQFFFILLNGIKLKENSK
jgi:hypothetical protein